MNAFQRVAPSTRRRSPLRAWGNLVLLVLAAAVGGCSGQRAGHDGDTEGLDPAHAKLLGQPAPELDPQAWANGQATSLAGLRGKVVLLDFWAVWCPPCVAMFPHLRELYDRFHSQGLEIVGVTWYSSHGFNESTGAARPVAGLAPADEEAAIGQFMQHHELRHPSAVLASDSPVLSAYGVEGIPQMVVIDRQGNVRLVLVGAGSANEQKLDATIEELLSEAG